MTWFSYWQPHLFTQKIFQSAFVLLTLLCLSSGQECAFPGYFIKGLESLHPSILNQDLIKDLIKTLPMMVRRCQVSDHA